MVGLLGWKLLSEFCWPVVAPLWEDAPEDCRSRHCEWSAGPPDMEAVEWWLLRRTGIAQTLRPNIRDGQPLLDQDRRPLLGHDDLRAVLIGLHTAAGYSTEL